MAPDLSFNTAVSFITNTNWQNYGGESTLSYLVQMLGLTHQNFLSAATGIVLIPVEVRGVGEFEPAFAAMLRERPDAVMVTNDPFHQHRPHHRVFGA